MMKFKLLIAELMVFLLIPNLGIAQSMNWSDIGKFEGGDIRPIFLDGQNYYAIAHGAEYGYALLKFDHNHNLQNASGGSTKFNGRLCGYNDIIKTKSGDYLVGDISYKSPRALEIVAARFDKDGFEQVKSVYKFPFPHELTFDYNENIRSDRRINHSPQDTKQSWFVSENQSKVLYCESRNNPNTNNKKEFVLLTVFNDKLDFLWTKQFHLEELAKRVKIEEARVSDDGKVVYLLAKKFEKTVALNYKDDAFNYVIYEVSADSLKEHQLVLDNEYQLSKCNFIITDEGREIKLVGLYSHSASNSYFAKGHFFATISSDDFTMQYQLFPFSQEFRDSINYIIYEDEDKEFHSDYFYFNGLRQTNNGNIVYVLDYNRLSGDYNGLSGNREYSLYPRDMINIVFSPSNELLEEKIIERDLVYKNRHKGRNVDFSISKAGEACLLYYDHDLNEAKNYTYKFKVATFDENGFLRNQQFLDSVMALGSDLYRLHCLINDDVLLIGGRRIYAMITEARKKKMIFGLMKLSSN